MTSLALILLLWAGSGLVAEICGRVAAYVDLAQGRYVTLTYGLPPAQFPAYVERLRARYGIEVRAVAGCIVSRELSAYVRGYNRVSERAARRRFGPNIFLQTTAHTRE
jgi:hypothetical protein